MLKRDKLYESGTYSAVMAQRQLRPSYKLVYNALVRRLGENLSAWPGQELIAADTGLDIRTVERGIVELISREIISIVGKMGRANQYAFHEVSPEPSGPGRLVEPTEESQVSEPGRLAPEPGRLVVGPRSPCDLDPVALHVPPGRLAPEPGRVEGLTLKNSEINSFNEEPKKEFAQRTPSPVTPQPEDEINCDELLAPATQVRGSSLRSLPHDEPSIFQEDGDDERVDGVSPCSSKELDNPSEKEITSHPASLLGRFRQHHQLNKE